MKCNVNAVGHGGVLFIILWNLSYLNNKPYRKIIVVVVFYVAEVLDMPLSSHFYI